MMPRPAFTLIELLVVVTIIVILLALLTPAIDKAMYTAELAADTAQLDGFASGVIQYAAQSRRFYPQRVAPRMGYGHAQPSLMKMAPNADVRVPLRGFVSDEMYIDPFCEDPGLDKADPDSNILGPYALWFDYGYTSTGKWNGKLGEGLVWDNQTYRVLVSDFDWISPPGGLVVGSHPDADGLLQSSAVLNGGVADPINWVGKWSHSRWNYFQGYKRGTVELNFAYDDGSAGGVREVTRGDLPENRDDRMAQVPVTPYYTDTVANGWVHIPKR